MKCSKNGVAAGRKNTTPSDLFEIITEKNHALRALGALLGTAKLSEFDSENYNPGSQGKFDAESLQLGISKLVNLYLDDLERTLSDFSEDHQNSDEYLIDRSASLMKMAEEGAWLAGCIPEATFLETLGNLETVIDRNSVYSPMAGNLKTSLMKYCPPKTRQDIDQGGAL